VDISTLTQKTIRTMRSILLWMCILVGIQKINGQTQVPVIESFNVSLEKVNFPLIDHALPQVVLISFNRNAEKEASTWVDPLVQKFIRKSGLLDAMFEAKLYSLSFLNESEFLQVKLAEDRLKSEIPSELHSATFFTHASKDSLRALLNGKSNVFVAVISSSGKLLGFVQGDYSLEKMEKIEQIILDAP
jgi:hypothetical protein